MFSGVLWPYTLVSVALIGNTSWLCDPKWESYALEQSERLVSHARATKVVHNFAWNPLCNKVLHSFALNPLYMYHCSLFTMFRLDQNDYLLSGKFKQYSGRRWRYRNTIEFWMDISGSGLDLGVLFHSGHVSTWKLSRHLDCNWWVKWEKVLSNIFVFSSLINLQ